jgi:hypothetical protein
VTDDRAIEIDSADVDWDKAEVREGRQPAAVVSVRLSPEEAARLREYAESLGVTVSEVLRQALAAFEPGQGRQDSRDVIVTAFTYAASSMPAFEEGWTYTGPQHLFSLPELAKVGTAAPTGTEPARIKERVTTGPPVKS